MGRVRVTVVAVEKVRVLNIMGVCVLVLVIWYAEWIFSASSKLSSVACLDIPDFPTLSHKL
jgi:hypothetical protein